MLLPLCLEPVRALVAAAPPGVVESVAGLALLTTFGSALSAALAVPDGLPDAAVTRLPAAVTFLVAAAGVTVGGIGGAFWGLAAGVVASVLLGRRTATG